MPANATWPLDMQPYGCILFGRMDEVFKALADESRRLLLDRLHARNGQTSTSLLPAST